MNFIYESLIIIAIAFAIIGFASIICFRDRHYFIKSKDIEKKHYILRKSRFLFLYAFAVTWNWKSGIILKSTFWGTLGFYAYYLCFYVADMVYFIVTDNYMIITKPIIFVIFAVIVPWVLAILFCAIKSIILAIRKEEIDYF